MNKNLLLLSPYQHAICCATEPVIGNKLATVCTWHTKHTTIAHFVHVYIWVYMHVACKLPANAASCSATQPPPAILLCCHLLYGFQISMQCSTQHQPHSKQYVFVKHGACMSQSQSYMHHARQTHSPFHTCNQCLSHLYDSWRGTIFPSLKMACHSDVAGCLAKSLLATRVLQEFGINLQHAWIRFYCSVILPTPTAYSNFSTHNYIQCIKFWQHGNFESHFCDTVRRHRPVISYECSNDEAKDFFPLVQVIGGCCVLAACMLQCLHFMERICAA